MTPQAIESDKKMGLPLFDVRKIYSDPDFNCRGEITPIDVVDLAKDIAITGLQQPIVIRPRLSNTPSGFDYVLVAGHRRHKAYFVNAWFEIPAILRTDLSELSARSLNLKENLKRQELNILQEAKAIQPYRNAGWNREAIALELGVSQAWVQIRVMVLDLPKPVQDAIAVGVLNQTQIREVYSLKDVDKQLAAVKAVKEHKERSETRERKITTEIIKKPTKATLKRIRKTPEIFSFMEEIVAAYGQNCFATRCLAWSIGEVSDFEIRQDLQKFCVDAGKTYTIPTFDEI